MSAFIDGDLVRLKSGGPIMVVRHKNPIDDYRDNVYVSWFKPDGCVAEHMFNSVVLTKFGGGQ